MQVRVYGAEVDNQMKETCIVKNNGERWFDESNGFLGNDCMMKLV